MEKNITHHHCCNGPIKKTSLHQEHNSTICYIAGHSGGHIIPCLTLAQAAKEEYQQKILFITSTKTLDTNIIQESTLVDYHYTLAITQRRRWYLMPLIAITLGWSFIQSLFIFLWHRPVRVISTGSIIAIPGCLAAWILRIPIELFEVNAKPGKTMLFLSRFATNIAVCFSQPKHFFTKVPCEIRPYPVRFVQPTEIEVSHLSHFSPHRCTLFIQGGSQGSTGINHLIKKVIETNPHLAPHIQIIHQTGRSPESWRHIYAQHQIPCHVFSYEHNMAPYYMMADLVICRAGAGSLFETLYFEKPCITIPLITANTHHQHDNAHAMAAAYPELFCVLDERTAAKNLPLFIEDALQKML